MKQISPIFLLLLLLPLACSASVAVHDAQISVRSVSSIVYRGTQISLFESDGHANRLFHQPLSFLDTESLRVFNDGELNRTRLYLDIYLWTDEFVKLVRSRYDCRVSVELMPMTHLQLTWSANAVEWLGEGFNASYRLVGNLRDGDKPQMRTTFAIDCLDGGGSCRRLLRRLNSSEQSAQLLDLRYRVRGDSSERLLLPIRSQHLLQSDTFRRLSRFARSLGGGVGVGRVLVSDATVDSLVEETVAAALLQRQRETGQEVSGVDVDSRSSIESNLQRLFRSRPVESPTRHEWRREVFWPSDRASVRPDRLALMLNSLLTPAAATAEVRLSSKWQEVVAEIGQSVPAKVATRIRDFAHSHRVTDARNRTISVDDVIRLSDSLDSSVAWDVHARHFVAAPLGLLYRLDIRELERRGQLTLQSAKLSVRHAQHSDHVNSVEFRSTTTTAAAAAAAAAAADCCTSASELLEQMRGLRLNLTDSVEEVSDRLNRWMQRLAPVNERRGDKPELTFDLPKENDETRMKRLEKRVDRLEKGGPYQKRFADSFCLLAHFSDPEGMRCQTIGFHVPRKSLRHNPFTDRRVRYQLGSVGASFFRRPSDKFFEMKLRICCTA